MISGIRKGRIPYQKISCIVVILSLIFVFYVRLFGSSDEVTAIRAGYIITVTKDTIENGTIIVRDGLIESVGVDVVIPAGCYVINADTMYVYPGFIDAHSSVAISTSAKSSSVTGPQGVEGSIQPVESLTPHRLAADMLNPKDSKIKKVRESGVTTVLTIPDRGIFIGQSALINLNDGTGEEMILKSPVAMHLGYTRSSGKYPSTLMGVIAFQRQTFYDAKHYKLIRDRYKKHKRGIKRPTQNKALDALNLVLNGSMPMIVNVNKENEIKRALRLSEEFNVKFILSGVVEGWRVADLLRNYEMPLIVSLNFPKPEDVTGYSFKLKVEGPEKSEKSDKDKEKEETEEEKEIYSNPSVLSSKGLKLAFTFRGINKPEDFRKNIIKAVKHGMSKEEALKAITINPAEIFGVEDQIGSIEEGKIANLVIMTADFFDEKSTVKYVFVDGKRFEIEKPKKKKKSGNEADVDVSGTWDATVSSPDGDVSVKIIFKASGEELTGTFSSEFGSAEIYDGSISGNQIEFSVKLSVGGQEFEMVFTGQVEGNTIDGTVDLGVMGSARWKAIKPNIV